MTIKPLFSLAVASCLLAATACTRALSQLMSAALVILNGNVRTLDKARPQAEAVAVHGTGSKLADLVLLPQDIFRINPVEIERTKIRLTIMDGRVVYEEKR